MKKLTAVGKVFAAGLTTLITVTSGLLSLPALKDFFADQIGWLQEHLSSQQATAVGGVLLALGLFFLCIEVRDRGLKPRKSMAAMGLLWVVSSLALIFFAPNHLKPIEEIGVGQAEALNTTKTPTAEKHLRGSNQAQKPNPETPESTESVSLSEEGSSASQASPAATNSASRSSKSSCTCPGSSSAPSPPVTPQPSEPSEPFAEEERREEAEEAREEEQEAAEEAEFAREEAELGI